MMLLLLMAANFLALNGSASCPNNFPLGMLYYVRQLCSSKAMILLPSKGIRVIILADVRLANLIF